MLLVLYLTFFSAPISFPEGRVLSIEQGLSVREVGALLEEEKIIRSPSVFKVLVRLMGGRNIAGKYSFQQRENIFSVAWRIAEGDFNIKPVRVQVLEGATVRDIATLLSEKVPGFNDDAFYRLAKPKEGYLFPDTYFIYPGSTPENILHMLENGFKDITEHPLVEVAIQGSGHSLSEIVIMASILEKEVPATYDRRLIAGILWKRIELGMPLQVDAVFPYIIGKNSYELTRDDLTIDSPYNTYVYKGLPVGPIANPSLDAILAAATPIKSDYLFYLSDREGELHYSVTYEQHLAAKRKYIDS